MSDSEDDILSQSDVSYDDDEDEDQEEIIVGTHHASSDKKRLQSVMSVSRSHDDDDNSFAAVPKEYQQPSKRQKKSDSGKLNNSKVVGIDLDNASDYLSDGESEDDVMADPNDAFLITESAAAQMKLNRQRSANARRMRNILLLGVQEQRKAKLVESLDSGGLTNAEKAGLKLLKRKEAKKSIRDVIAADTLGLVSIICEAPYQTEVDNLLGELDPDLQNCFGCSFGVGYTLIDEGPTEELTDFINKIWASGDAKIMAILISHKYEIRVRVPHNKAYKANTGCVPLPSWDARQVYECLNNHKILNASLWLTSEIRKLVAHEKAIEASMYSVDSAIIAKGGEPTPQDLAVNIVRHKAFLETIEMQRKLRLMDPTKMYGGRVSEKLNVTPGANTVVTKKLNTYAKGNQLLLTDMTVVRKGM